MEPLRCRFCLSRPAREDGYCSDEDAARAARPPGHDSRKGSRRAGHVTHNSPSHPWAVARQPAEGAPDSRLIPAKVRQAAAKALLSEEETL